MRFRSCSRISAPVPSRLTYSLTILLVLLGCAAQLSAQNVINTIAGGGTLPTTYNALSASATGNFADIPGPTAVVVDHQGNMYVVSPTANQVYMVDPTGTTITVYAGMGWPAENPQLYDGLPATQGYLNYPSGLAIDSVGNIYVADTQADLVRRIDAVTHIMTTVAGTSHNCQNSPPCGNFVPAVNANLSVPAGVATDTAGNLYIVDTGDNQIRVVNMQSSNITVYGVSNLKPGYIATVVGTGAMCSSPTSKCGDGGKATAAMLKNPTGASIDHLGNMFIADSGDHRIRGVIPTGYIGAYAGTGVPCNGGPCGDGGPSLSAQLSDPAQIYIDGGDNLYITDPPTNRVRKVVPGKNPPTTATISTYAGNGAVCTDAHVTSTFCGDTLAPTSAWLNLPSGVYLDTASNVYIADSGDQRVRKVTSKSNTINTYAGGGLGDGAGASAILAGNRDVAVDNVGDVYVADTGNNTIRKISAGMVTTVAGAGMSGYFGNGIRAVNANLNQPWGLALDAEGNIYIADTYNLVIRVVNTQSSPIKVAGVTIQPSAIGTVAGTPGQACTLPVPACGDGGPSTSATFGLPAEVALDNEGNFFVADSSAHRIREVNIASGTITTLAGTGSQCPTPTNFAACGDGGLATAAQLSEPHGVVVDSSDNVYIADSGDNRIRVVNTSTGVINAFAFNGLFNSFGPDGVAALSSGYTLPLYVAVDSRDNVFVSGSSIYYLVQRIDVSTNPIVNPVASVAGRGAGDAKYYGFFGDGSNANGAYIDNYAARVDSGNNLYIADGGNNRVREVSSSPTVGMAPTPFISPTSLTFPPTVVGQQSRMSFQLINTGDDDLLVSLPSISGPFTFANQSPCVGNIVTPDTTCTYTVIFTPTADGTAKGTATVNDNGFNNPSQSVALTGTGPDFTIAANPTSLTIARGGQGQSTITLTPEAGYNQNITLSCTGLPTGVACASFVPNPVVMNGTSAQNSTLTISVSSSTVTGTYTIGVKGASVTTHTTPITLTVQ